MNEMPAWLILQSYFSGAMNVAKKLAEVIALQRARCSGPNICSALSYYDGYRTARLRKIFTSSAGLLVPTPTSAPTKNVAISTTLTGQNLVAPS